MLFEFQRVEPHSVRDDVVNFLWGLHHWPGQTREDYYDMWDWRYTALSEGDPLVYIARLSQTGELVGHIAVYRRNFRLENVNLRIGVPGNLLVHPNWQNSMIGVRLIAFVRSLVQRGEFDAIIAFGNRVVNPMFAQFGFTELGAMHTYVDVRDARPVLRRRHRPFAALAPFVNLVFSARRRLRSSSRRQQHSPIRVDHLTSDQFLELDRSHWMPTNRLVASDSNRFVVQRYLNQPHAQRQLYGLFDPPTGSLEAYVVVEDTGRIRVLDCQTNPATIDPPAAIAAVVAHRPDAETVLVPTLPQSQLAQELIRAGFLDREAVDLTEANTFLSVYSLPTSPHAAVLNDPTRWNLWLGSRHY